MEYKNIRIVLGDDEQTEYYFPEGELMYSTFGFVGVHDGKKTQFVSLDTVLTYSFETESKDKVTSPNDNNIIKLN
jgi:hypothetical protein